MVRLRQLVEETQTEVPGLNVGLTGEPVLEMDEMAQSQKDTALAAVVSLVLSALIFIYGYGETGREQILLHGSLSGAGIDNRCLFDDPHIVIR